MLIFDELQNVTLRGTPLCAHSYETLSCILISSFSLQTFDLSNHQKNNRRNYYFK